MRKLHGFALITGVSLALLAGCSGGGDDGGKIASISSPPKTSDNKAAANGKGGGSDAERADQVRAFAKCMREHGIDMPDPQTGPDGKGIAMQAMPADGADEPKMKAADDACKKLLPNGGEMKPPSPEELDKMRKDAKCMREHGINMPDPDPNGGGGRITIDAGGDQSKMEAAAKACGMGGFTASADSAPAK